MTWHRWFSGRVLRLFGLNLLAAYVPLAFFLTICPAHVHISDYVSGPVLCCPSLPLGPVAPWLLFCAWMWGLASLTASTISGDNQLWVPGVLAVVFTLYAFAASFFLAFRDWPRC